MTVIFVRNHKDNGLVGFNNSLINKGEPWRLFYHNVKSVYANRDILHDGRKINSYTLFPYKGETITIDASVWMLSQVDAQFRD